MNYPFPIDIIIQRLYDIALKEDQNKTSNVIGSLLEEQEKQYNKFLELARSGSNGSRALLNSISKAKNSNAHLKRMYENDKYVKGMEFFRKFKERESQAGSSRMDWKKCVHEGMARGILKYKTSDSLRVQYSKYIK
jgi:hypothetical protein